MDRAATQPCRERAQARLREIDPPEISFLEVLDAQQCALLDRSGQYFGTSLLRIGRSRMAALSSEFIQAQQKRLQALRAQLLGAEDRALASERSSREDHGEEAGDAVDKAQDQVQRDVGQALHDVDAPRLRNIDRALQKIAEGTYGISDASGTPIPEERLEATPEAVLTVEEEKARPEFRARFE